MDKLAASLPAGKRKIKAQAGIAGLALSVSLGLPDACRASGATQTP